MSCIYEEIAKTNEKPVLVFLKHYDSHNFNDRTIIVNEEVKIGRAVARLKSANNNAIFDCKVLSRNHALISYTDKKFILKDTKSSNGTYVNSTRVTKEDSDYGEREIFSNDIIKFGVEVLEHGTTHGCIVTQVKLYHPNGMEAIQGRTVEPPVMSDVTMKLSSERFFKLESYVVDALYREGNIRNQIAELKNVIDEIDDSSKVAWKAMLNEELLLDKISLYETELRLHREDLSEDSLKFKVSELLQQLSENQLLYKTNLEKYIKAKDEMKCTAMNWENKWENLNQENNKLKSDLYLSQESYTSLLAKMDDRSKLLEKTSDELRGEFNKRVEVEKKLADSAQEISSLKNSINQETDEKNAELCNGLTNGDIEIKKESDESAFHVGNVSVDHVEVVNSTQPLMEVQPNQSSDLKMPIKSDNSVSESLQVESSTEILDNNNLKSFHEEYKMLVEKLEKIEQELSICKEDQKKAKSENTLLTKKMLNSEEEIMRYQEKCTLLESQLRDSSANKVSPNADASAENASPSATSITNQLNIAYNIFLLPIMFFLLGIIWSIFSYFNHR